MAWEVMMKFNAAIVVFCAAFSMMLAVDSASARSASGSIRAQCHKEAGAYWNPDRRRWQYQGGIGTSQRQRFYDCLDSRTMKRR